MSHLHYMNRCIELAKLGAGFVAPNPMVGAVLVHDGKIIGEGWHQQFGGPHAEVNAIRQAAASVPAVLRESTLYVSLEPCSHHGKTPPCTDLIIQHKIPKVFIGCRDPFNEVNGKGIEKLKAAGVEVEMADRLLAYECEKINKRFFVFHTQQRPYIILKWAQTGDGKMASPPTPLHKWRGETLESESAKDSLSFDDSKTPPAEGLGEALRLLISNDYSNRLVHKWRSEEVSILIGTNTAMLDDPELTTRLWSGPSPVRLVIDMDLRLPKNLKIFNGQQPTIVFNTQLHDVEENMTVTKLKEKGGVSYYKVKHSDYPLKEILNALYKLEIQSVLVEGGAKLLQSFIDEGLWDETRIINNYSLTVGEGLSAPKPENAILVESEELFSDTIETYMHAKEDY